MTAPADGAELVAYAAGDGWIERMPADEWARLSLEERTAKIAAVHLFHSAERLERQQPKSEQDRLLKEVRTTWLRELAWRAWCSLPSCDRDVLKALRVTLIEGSLDKDTHGLCVTRWDDQRRFPPATHIVLDPARYVDDDEATILETIFHELAHAAYRHIDLQSWIKSEEHAKTLQGILELHAILMGKTWRLRLQDQEREHGELNQAP